MQVRSALEFARIVDSHDGQVSLTNILVAVTGAAVTIAPSPITLGAFVVAQAAYQLKKWFGASAASADRRDADVVAQLAARVEQVAADVSATKDDLGTLKFAAQRGGR